MWMAHEARAICMFIAQKQPFLQVCLDLTGDGEDSQTGRDVLVKAQQLRVKVVGCQMLLQPPWGSPGEGALSRSGGCMFQPIHRAPTWLEVNFHLVLSNEVSLPFGQPALSFFEGQHCFPVPFQLLLLRTMSLVLPEQAVVSWLSLAGL